MAYQEDNNRNSIPAFSHYVLKKCKFDGILETRSKPDHDPDPDERGVPVIPSNSRGITIFDKILARLIKNILYASVIA
jgi:hypothetical protein